MKKFILAASLLVSCSALAQLNRSRFMYNFTGPSTIPIEFTGSELFAPGYVDTQAAELPMYITTTPSVICDSVDNNGSTYYNFGLLRSNSIIDAVVSVQADYEPTSPDYFMHGGVTTRMSNKNNSDQDFAGMMLISVAGNEFHVIDRVAGTETYTRVTGISPALAYDTRYRLHFENRYTNYWEATLYTEAGSSLGTTNGFFSAGVSNVGWQGLHTFASKMTVYSCWVGDASSNTIVAGTPIYMRGFGNHDGFFQYGGAAVTNGALTFYSDGSFHTDNNWNMMQSAAASNGNFTATGFMAMKSGRAHGIILRADNNFNCYSFTYDDLASSLRCYEWLNQGPTQLDSQTLVLSANTLYPWTLTANGSSLTFVINSVTSSVTDASYVSGRFGFMGYQGQTVHSNVVVTPLP